MKDKIKEEALRTYLITFSSSYESLSMDQLAKNFDLSLPRIHRIVTKSVMNGELHAGWDQPSGCIVFRNVEHSRVQALAFELTNKYLSLQRVMKELHKQGQAMIGWITIPLLQVACIKTCPILKGFRSFMRNVVNSDKITPMKTKMCGAKEVVINR
ncbi:putative proteasome component (PCI) domain-containing protein [Medicago truncatula]|uniref:Putative proteasome component (PCI) domain-containing protein n=1 Tax=Medicago truncatula TaxID=3880 RepID=A0A396JFJ4_MEDTR|nr:putative proteasome component (PCI) domain-containing protein [Medicago truncatula]